jgi:DNA-directed RNA polymerase subunit RPC12/RpoP
MDKIYADCPYCLQEILRKPILEKHQGRYSILCPYCLSHRSEWVDTIENAIVSWNKYMRDDNICTVP